MQIPIVIYPKKATGVMNGGGTIEVKKLHLQQRNFRPLLYAGI